MRLYRCLLVVLVKNDIKVWQMDRLAFIRFLGGSTSLLLGECLNGCLGCGERKSC